MPNVTIREMRFILPLPVTPDGQRTERTSLYRFRRLDGLIRRPRSARAGLRRPRHVNSSIAHRVMLRKAPYGVRAAVGALESLLAREPLTIDRKGLPGALASRMATGYPGPAHLVAWDSWSPVGTCVRGPRPMPLPTPPDRHAPRARHASRVLLSPIDLATAEGRFRCR